SLHDALPILEFFRHFRKVLANIACMAILFNAVAPAVSHALSSDQDNTTTWMQVCTVAGVKLIPLDIGDRPDTPPNNAATTMEHCAYCFNHTDAWAIPSAPYAFSAYLKLSYQLPELFYHAPRPLFAWASANPRAPPYLA